MTETLTLAAIVSHADYMRYYVKYTQGLTQRAVGVEFSGVQQVVPELSFLR